MRQSHGRKHAADGLYAAACLSGSSGACTLQPAEGHEEISLLFCFAGRLGMLPYLLAELGVQRRRETRVKRESVAR